MEPEPSEARKQDCFGPPEVPCECYCLHCQRTFMSDGIWWFRVLSSVDHTEIDGMWMCPTPNCDGKGFSFDIFPTDPAHPANDGWTWSDDEEDMEFDEDGEPVGEKEYDPAEPDFAELNAFHSDDDDLEGEEWKHGLAPGERPPPPPEVDESRRQWQEREERYDMPDERPRMQYRSPDEIRRNEINDNDIPF